MCCFLFVNGLSDMTIDHIRTLNRDAKTKKNSEKFILQFATCDIHIFPSVSSWTTVDIDVLCSVYISCAYLFFFCFIFILFRFVSFEIVLCSLSNLIRFHQMFENENSLSTFDMAFLGHFFVDVLHVIFFFTAFFPFSSNKRGPRKKFQSIFCVSVYATET